MTAQHLGTGWGVSEEDRWAKGTGGRSRDNWNPVRPAVTTVTAMLTETGLCWSFYLHNYFVEQDLLCAMSVPNCCAMTVPKVTASWKEVGQQGLPCPGRGGRIEGRRVRG